MKKFAKVFTLIAVPVIAASMLFAGCKSCKGKAVDPPPENQLMRDIEVPPEQHAYYEAQSRQVIEEYQEVAARHTDANGEVDANNSEVVAAASSAAAKLYAFACYNERYLDKFVFFGDQVGDTDVSGFGSATAERQEYFLRVNESENTCGYRYHRTIKKVKESSGTIDTFKSLFESARVRMTDKTNLLYRFEGNDIRYGEHNDALSCDVLTCNWRTGDDWGKADIEMVKGSYLETLDDIKADILASANGDNKNIRGNINILADNIVKYANIVVDEETGGIFVLMTIDTDVANADDASMAMLKNANGTSGNCLWKGDPSTVNDEGFGEDTGLRIIYALWPNGLFRMYNIIERWEGKMDLKIAKPTGLAESTTLVYYSYSDHDCDMAGYLNMLEAAKEQVG